jgi:fission 1 protein
MAEAFFNNLTNKIEGFFTGGDSLPWTDSEMIASCELEASGEKAAVSGDNNASMMRLAWALVHSRNASDVQRGIAMLEASLAGVGAPTQKREVLYLLAVGQFRAGEYARSRRLVDQALSISPDFRQASSLKKMVEDKIAKDGLVGVGLAAAAVGVVASGIAAAVIGGRRR